MKSVRPNCTVKLMDTAIVPEKKPFSGVLYRDQHLTFSFRKIPNREIRCSKLWALGQTREIHFKDLKMTDFVASENE